MADPTYDDPPTPLQLKAMAKIDALAEDLKAMGLTEMHIGHALCSSGLVTLRGCLCNDHLVEQLLYVRGFIDLKVEETKQEMVQH